MRLKNVSCSEEDFEGFCGRMNGVRLMKTMENQPPPTPTETPSTGRTSSRMGRMALRTARRAMRAGIRSYGTYPWFRCLTFRGPLLEGALENRRHTGSERKRS